MLLPQSTSGVPSRPGPRRRTLTNTRSRLAIVKAAGLFRGQSQEAALPAAHDPGCVLIHSDEVLMQADSSDCGHGWSTVAKTKGRGQTMGISSTSPQEAGTALRHFLAGDSQLCSGFLSLWQAELHGAGTRESRGHRPAAREILPGHTMPGASPFQGKGLRCFQDLRRPATVRCPHARSLTPTTLETRGLTQHLPTHLARPSPADPPPTPP